MKNIYHFLTKIVFYTVQNWRSTQTLYPLNSHCQIVATSKLRFPFRRIQMFLLADSENQRNPQRPNSTFWKIKPWWVALIYVSVPQTNDKRTFWGASHCYFLLEELCPQSVEVSGFTKESLAAEHRTSLTVDGCWTCECRSCAHPVLLPSLAVVIAQPTAHSIMHWAERNLYQ